MGASTRNWSTFRRQMTVHQTAIPTHPHPQPRNIGWYTESSLPVHFQVATNILQPVAIGNPWWNTGDDLIQCQIGIQPLATAENLFKRIDVRAPPKGHRLHRFWDCLVS